MDVICFLYISLGSSTVQLHDSLGACACSEAGTNEEQRSVVRFIWAKGLNTKGIHKEMFPVYCRKYLTRKTVHNYVEIFSQGRSKFAYDTRPSRSVEIATEATVSGWS
jgi:hypothetical protein